MRLIVHVNCNQIFLQVMAYCQSHEMGALVDEEDQFRTPYRQAPERLSGRIIVLKFLRQSEGLTLERVAALNTEQRGAISWAASSPEDLHSLIRRSLTSLVDDQYTRALKNAYGIDPENYDGKNLTERRAIYEKYGPKLRTIINHEDIGIELLAQQIDVISRMGKDSDAVDPAVLAARVDALRSELAALRGYWPQENGDLSTIVDIRNKLINVERVVDSLSRRMTAAETNIKTLWNAVQPQHHHTIHDRPVTLGDFFEPNNPTGQ